MIDAETARVAVINAIAKRDRIIAKEGDMNGKRREPWYLETLIQEEIEQDMAIREYNGIVAT